MRPNDSKTNEYEKDIKERFGAMNKAELLKVAVHCIRNIHRLANAVDNIAPSIANALDAIASGNSIDLSSIGERKMYGIIGSNLLMVDIKDRIFTRTDLKTNKIYTDIITMKQCDVEVMLRNLVNQ